MRKIMDKKRFSFFLIFLLISIGIVFWGGYELYQTYLQKTEFTRAGKQGEVKTYQLLIQIQKRNGTPEILAQGFQRGDIVLFTDENKQFSTAEQEGFLIIKMHLTQSQADLLTSSIAEVKQQKNPQKPEENPKQQGQKPLRRYFVDLEKIGITSEQNKGQVIADKIFEWAGVVKEK